jgi:chromosome segregation ATPase
MVAIKGKAKSKKKRSTSPKKAPRNDRATTEPSAKELARELENLKRQNAGLKRDLANITKTSKAQVKRIASLEGKMETRVKREDILMTALGLRPQTKKGEKGSIDDLTQSILKVDEHILNMGKRMENMLSALKNHREYLIRLNKKVYKVDPVKRIEMEIEIIGNTLSIMALSGFDINKGLFGEMKRVNKMLEKEDADLSKIQKRMATIKRKFDEDMERFDFESIFRKSDHIPGYR